MNSNVTKINSIKENIDTLSYSDVMKIRHSLSMSLADIDNEYPNLDSCFEATQVLIKKIINDDFLPFINTEKLEIFIFNSLYDLEKSFDGELEEHVDDIIEHIKTHKTNNIVLIDKLYTMLIPIPIKKDYECKLIVNDSVCEIRDKIENIMIDFIQNKKLTYSK